MREHLKTASGRDDGGDLCDGEGAVLFVFNENHQVMLVRGSGRAGEPGRWTVPWVGRIPEHSAGTAPPRRACGVATGEPVWIEAVEVSPESGPAVEDGVPERLHLYFAEATSDAGKGEENEAVRFFSIEEMVREVETGSEGYAPLVGFLLPRIRAHLLRLPYLSLRESDYIFRFRTEKERNREVYRLDAASGSLYQSALCEAIKAIKRVSERSSASPAALNFGSVRYLLPSHFGFCLGVQNAIERAYECLAENPGRPVYMLSELIHNPFVNEDLQRRGLRYLQTDRGEPVRNPKSGRFYWDEIGRDAIVVIPAFGATNEDKRRLIEKGIGVRRYDATCMLVEKVWKAARRFGEEGYTVLIHGKSEHEETKATFSNAAAVGPSLVFRNPEEARRLGEVMLAEGAEEKRERFRYFEGRHTPGFSPERDLDRVAVVNQTTLLRNETLGIIEYLESVFEKKYGAGRVREHLHGGSKGDTLCYATQVNQDALERALAAGADAAVVVGGRNSSNTFQLFRMCRERLGEGAVFYVQSEENLLSRSRIRHYRFPEPGHPGGLEERPFLPDKEPVRVLVTGGASCPDGLIQQVIFRINGFFPPESLRPVETVLGEVRTDG